MNLNLNILQNSVSNRFNNVLYIKMEKKKSSYDIYGQLIVMLNSYDIYGQLIVMLNISCSSYFFY